MPIPWIRIQSALLAVVLTTALAVHLLLRKPTRRIYQEYALLALNLALWFLTDALHVLFEFSSELLNTLRLLFAAAVPVSSVRFLSTLLEDSGESERKTRRALLIAGILVGCVIAVPPLRNAIPEPFGAAGFFIYVFGGVSSGLLLIAKRLKQTQSASERGRLQSLLVAGGIALVCTVLDYLPEIGYFFFGNILVSLFLYFLFQIITKLRLLDLYEFLGRSIVMLSFALVIAAIFLFLTIFWRNRIDLFVFNAVIASLVVIILFEPLHQAVSNWTTQFLFSERFAFASELETLQAQVSKLVEAPAIAKHIVTSLDESRRVTHASVYILAEHGGSYELTAYVGSMPPRSIDVAQNTPMLELLMQDQLVTEEGLADALKTFRHIDTLEAEAVRERINQVKNILSEHFAGVIIPFISADKIIGYLALKDERLREPYSTEEIRLLYKVATQAAGALENSRVYHRLRERDRLAALGEMSAGLAHEIRNPLGAIKGAAQLMMDDEEEKEGQNDLANIVSSEADRLNTVVTQFLHFAKPYQVRQEAVELEDLLRKTFNLLEVRKAKELEIRNEFQKGLPEVWTDPEMLQTIMINLALNAFEAMKEEGTLFVRVFETNVADRFVSDAHIKMVTIQFQDTGPGISEDELGRIFIPFFTTKSKGTGLGLSICQRIVKGLGGFIEVHSPQGQGAIFSIQLPVSGFGTSEIPKPKPIEEEDEKESQDEGEMPPVT